MNIVRRDHADSRSNRSDTQAPRHQAIWPHRHPSKRKPNCQPDRPNIWSSQDPHPIRKDHLHRVIRRAKSREKPPHYLQDCRMRKRKPRKRSKIIDRQNNMNTIHLYQDWQHLVCSYDRPRENNIFSAQVSDDTLETIKNGTLEEVREILSIIIDTQIAQTLPTEWVNHLGGIETRDRD